MMLYGDEYEDDSYYMIDGNDKYYKDNVRRYIEKKKQKEEEMYNREYQRRIKPEPCYRGAIIIVTETEILYCNAFLYAGPGISYGNYERIINSLLDNKYNDVNLMRTYSNIVGENYCPIRYEESSLIRNRKFIKNNLPLILRNIHSDYYDLSLLFIKNESGIDLAITKYNDIASEEFENSSFGCQEDKLYRLNNNKVMTFYNRGEINMFSSQYNNKGEGHERMVASRIPISTSPFNKRSKNSSEWATNYAFLRGNEDRW